MPLETRHTGLKPINPESKASTSDPDESNSLTMLNNIQKLTNPTFFLTKGRLRAKSARELHEIIGNQNDFVLCISLDDANLLSTFFQKIAHMSVPPNLANAFGDTTHGPEAHQSRI